MPNPWGSLGLGGRVDVRGATPPIGNTTGGGGTPEGMGLMALLRRLSMGLTNPDPASPNGMQNLGRPDEMVDMGRMMMGLDETPMDPSMMTGMGPGMGAGNDMLSGGSGDDMMGQMPAPPPGGMVAAPGMDVGFPTLPPSGTSMTPEQQRMAYEEEMRRLAMSGF